MLEGWAHLLGCRLPIDPSGHGAWEAGVCILDILLSTKYIATFLCGLDTDLNKEDRTALVEPES